MEEKFIKITSAVYRLLDFFPEGEPLKNRAKDKALAITEGLISLRKPAPADKDKLLSQFLEDIEILLNYLKIAKSFGWIDSVNFLIVSKEYENIKKQITPERQPERQMEKIVFGEPKPPAIAVVQIQKVTPEFLISDRQKKILQILGEKGKAQVSDFKAVLGDITKRTIRRDLDDLLKNKKIIRTGEWNQVFYEVGHS
ncbi:MAG: DeoR family transcriptional regulator [Candidatus Staskawiczbacteria bacterium]|nr:DeoR family transcriptional regulator [Candidatus Staskawiczbacteria bacterium]